MKLDALKENINYLIDNNRSLEEKGLKPYSICIEGGHGIGKTAIVEEIAQERGCKFTKINLGAFEEVGDLTGFPVKKYRMIKDGEYVEVVEASLEAHMKAGYELVPGTDPVMDFAIPSWVPKEEDGSNILMLDDYSRANPLILQATMELLDKGELGSWKLPSNTQIILTSNPDNGEYSVSSMDSAQKTRFITFNTEFDVKLLAKHMEEVQVRSEFINFALIYPEIFEVNSNNNHATGRTYMAFARSLESVKDLSTNDGLGRALQIAEGIFDSEDNLIGQKFGLFIKKKLDKLISPEDMVNKSWEDVKKVLKTSAGTADSDNYRTDIAATLTFRFVNYTLHKLSKPAEKADLYVNRILDIVNDKEQFLTADLIYSLASKLFDKYPQRVSKLLVDKKFKDMLLN